MKNKISVIVCTYNGQVLVEKCLNSILLQNFPNFEIICMDGGSSDKTIEIIKKYAKNDSRIKIFANKKRFPEGLGYGKWQGYKYASGEVIAFIDQDNVLQDKMLFSKTISLFNLNSSLAGILGSPAHNLNDERILRYVSLIGTDSFFAYRSLDFIINLNRKRKEFEFIELDTDNMLLTGGNCFFYRKEDLDKIGGYTQDVLCIKKLIKNGKNKVAVIRNATKHYAEKNLPSLIKKKFFWGSKFSIRKNQERFNYFPSTKKERKAFLKNLAFNLLILPNLIHSFKLYSNSKDPVSFLFPIIAFLNTNAYAFGFLREKFSYRKGN
ncbi:MAG: glycosyltransferase family 2 protein [Nanoarchaeota archaeon]